jgi:hypothetical protein
MDDKEKVKVLEREIELLKQINDLREKMAMMPINNPVYVPIVYPPYPATPTDPWTVTYYSTSTDKPYPPWMSWNS